MAVQRIDLKIQKPTVNSYGVGGDDLVAVWKDILKKGPRDPNDGKTYAGLTSTMFSAPEADVEADALPGSKCLKDKYRVYVGVTKMTVRVYNMITVPKLGSSKLSPKAKKEWTRFAKGVTAHEKEHARKAAAECEKIVQEIRATRAMAEGSTWDEALERALTVFGQIYRAKFGGNRISERIKKVHKRFDSSSNHGPTLNTDIK